MGHDAFSKIKRPFFKGSPSDQAELPIISISHQLDSFPLAHVAAGFLPATAVRLLTPATLEDTLLPEVLLHPYFQGCNRMVSRPGVSFSAANSPEQICLRRKPPVDWNWQRRLCRTFESPATRVHRTRLRSNRPCITYRGLQPACLYCLPIG